jgi:hypothetical protein
MIGKTEVLHLSKIIMEHLSPKDDKLEGYRLYLQNCLNPQVSHSNLAEMDDSILKTFYKEDHPLSPPKYFDVFGGPDLSRFEDAVKKNIVIIKEHGKGEKIKIHDRRILQNNYEWSTIFILLKPTRYKNSFEVYETNFDYNVRLSEQYFIRHCSKKFEGKTNCYVDMLIQALEEEPFIHEHNEECCDFNNFLVNPISLGFNWILASHIKSNINSTKSHSESSDYHFFAILKTTCCLKNVRVASVTNDKMYIYLLHEQFENSVIHLESRNRNPGRNPLETKKKDKVNFSSTFVKRLECKCQCCENKNDYITNMEESGPQELYKIKMSGFDQLKMLGLFNKQTEETLLEACKLSMAAFDVEAMTIKIDSLIGNEDLNFPFETVSQKKFPRMAIARQVPILISWSDNLRLKEGLEPLVYAYDEKEKDSMIGQFIEDLLDQKERCFEAKLELLADLNQWISIFEEAHYKYFNINKEAEEDDSEEMKTNRKNALYSWKYGIFGLFANHLERLASRYIVWGFNCEAYDLVILCSMMTTYLKNTGRSQIRMQREGSKVKHFAFKGIQIREAKQLLGPGFSLETFSTMCELENPEEKKGKFPFDKLTSINFLTEKKLPAKACDWKNTLNPKASLTQEQVNEVLNLYEEKGFESVGEYLEYYLKLDVIILLKSMTKLTAGFYETLGLHVIDSQKYTIPSLATMGTQAYLMRDKRIGNFFANNTTIYSVRIKNMYF